jgi:hypothetical protein
MNIKQSPLFIFLLLSLVFTCSMGPGTNIVYEFHMYSPLAFTHQNASWVSSLVGQFAHYPDPDRIEAEGVAWEWFTDANPQAPAGDTNWTYYEGTLYQVNNADYEIGRPVVQVSSIGPGAAVWFDDITVREYDAADNLVRTVCSLSVDDASGLISTRPQAMSIHGTRTTCSRYWTATSNFPGTKMSRYTWGSSAVSFTVSRITGAD